MNNFKQTAIIAIANHKGGTGKTTTSINLSAELARLGLSVLLIDLDPQANASLHVGKTHPSDIPVTAVGLLTEEPEKLPLAIHEKTNLDGVSLIYGSLGLGRVEDELKEQSARPSEELKRKIQPLIGIYDAIIIDCPPSLRLLTSNALAAATHLIIPIESGSQYGLYGVTDLLKHVKKVMQVNPTLKSLGALLIRHDERQNACKLLKASAQGQIGKLIPIEISSSTKVHQAAITQQSVHDLERFAIVSRQYKELAKYIAENCDIKIEKAIAGVEE